MVLPTETVYGLAADTRQPRAIAEIFKRKGRPASNPLIVHVSSVDMARSVVRSWPADADRLAGAFWPGPLTLVMDAADDLDPTITAGGPTVAVRRPAHPVMLGVIEALGRPVVAPSANPSGYVSPTTAAHAEEHFADLLILDGGACDIGIESTVLQLEPLRILRPGAIGVEAIEAVLGRGVQTEAGSADERVDASPVVASPGVAGAHYQPRKPTRMVAAAQDLARADFGRVVVIAPRRFAGSCAGRSLQVIELPDDAAGYAAGLYDALRRADQVEGAAEIVVVAPDEDGDALWLAVADRLRRATLAR